MDFLERLNLTLLEFEEKIRPDDIAFKNIKHPFLFVIGAPRTGTTVLTQVIAFLYQFGYINNVAARFWYTPLTGLNLSRSLLGKEPAPSFKSSHARTGALSDIHEYGKFWMCHLGFPSSQDVDWIDLDDECRRVTYQALASIQSFFDRPVVMKGIFPAYCQKSINDMLGENAVWINIERNLIDTCLSVWKARNMKGRNKWFGWYIPKSDRGPLFDMSIDEQIAFQVLYFRKVYREMATCTIQLERLCDAPLKTLFDCIPHTQARALPKDALKYHGYPDRDHAKHFTRVLKKVSDDHFSNAPA
jgi:hypothetical protein